MAIGDGVGRASMCAARCKILGSLTGDCVIDAASEVDVVGSTLLIADVEECAMFQADQYLIGSET